MNIITPVRPGCRMKVEVKLNLSEFDIKGLHVYQALHMASLFLFESFILITYFKTVSTWLNHRHRAANHQDSHVYHVLFGLRVWPRVWGSANLSAVYGGNWRVRRSSMWAPWADDNSGSSIKWSEGKLKGLGGTGLYTKDFDMKHSTWPPKSPTSSRGKKNHFWWLPRSLCVIFSRLC